MAAYLTRSSFTQDEGSKVGIFFLRINNFAERLVPMKSLKTSSSSLLLAGFLWVKFFREFRGKVLNKIPIPHHCIRYHHVVSSA